MDAADDVGQRPGGQKATGKDLVRIFAYGISLMAGQIDGLICR